jgi:ribosomal protein L37AE/L43A
MTKMKILGKKVCPQCDSESIDVVAGGVTGSWICNECGYVGAFPEKPFNEDDEENPLIQEDLEEIRESMKKTKRSKK